MEALLNPATINPTVVYLILVVGMWLVITATHIGGTGVLELGALICLGISIYILTLLPTNWIAFVVLVTGVAAFLVVPFVTPRYARWAELGLILQAIGGYFLLAGAPVSLIVIGLTIGLSWLYNRFFLVPILHSHQHPGEYDDVSDVIGLPGRVVKALNPVGTINVNGEEWTARSTDPLEMGTEVIVTAKRGLELVVEKAKRTEGENFRANGAPSH